MYILKVLNSFTEENSAKISKLHWLYNALSSQGLQLEVLGSFIIGLELPADI